MCARASGASELWKFTNLFCNFHYAPWFSKGIIKICGGPFLWGALGSCPLCPLLNPALYGPLRHSNSIRNILIAFEGESNGKPLQILPECPACASSEPECTSNAFRLLPESISILQEFSWNAIQLSSESFDCRSNAARIQSKRPDWPSNESGRNSEHRRIAYLGIYEEFPLRRHSGSFRV